MSHPSARVLFGTALALLFSATASAQVIFGAAYNGPSQNASLYSINPVNGSASLIGSSGATGLRQLSAMAFNPLDGLLYAVGKNGGGANVLATINTSTGASSSINILSGFTASIFQDLTFASDGTLYGTSGGAVISINTTTAFTTLVGGGFAFTGDGLSFGPAGILYYANYSITSQVSLANGSQSSNVSLAFDGSINQTLTQAPRVAALSFYAPGATMYGTVFSGSGPSGSNDLVSYFVTLDVNTGNIVTLGTTVTGMDAIAVQISAIPEPSAYAMAAGLLGLGAVLLRRRKAA